MDIKACSLCHYEITIKTGSQMHQSFHVVACGVDLGEVLQQYFIATEDLYLKQRGYVGIEQIPVGSFNVVRLAAWAMKQAEPLDADGARGVVVTVGSVAGFDGSIGSAGYTASKAGIHGLTLSLAREFSRFGIRVAGIAPGSFDTPMIRDNYADTTSPWLEATPFPKRLGYPSEFGALVREIVENPMINGETIRLDGGIRMPWF